MRKELAHEIGMTERSVTGYESGAQESESGTLEKISKTLRFPEAFFFGGAPEVPTPDIASFRSLSKMTSSLRDSTLGAGAVALLLNDWIEARFECSIPNVPDLGSDVRGLSTDIEGAEAAAEMLRAHGDLGEQPRKNIITLLESKGIRVYSLAIYAKEVDAFSMGMEAVPLCFSILLNLQGVAALIRRMN